MQRYFSNKLDKKGYLLSDDDIYHIKKVMRMNIGEKIEVVYHEKVFICEIVSLNPFEIIMINELEEYNESKKKVIVVQSLVNENKMDFILQKGTELGGYSFYGYKAVNSIIKENDKSEKKLLRWQKIVKEAAEQSKRNIIPEVVDIINLKELCKLEADLKIVLSVKEKSNVLKNVLQRNNGCDTIIIVVGPEGGFTTWEEEELNKNGFISASLGKRVLRTETASLMFLSCINYEWMV